MVIGFTGTYKGMTPYQKQRILELLKELKPQLVRHGDCVGADTEFHEIAKTLNIKVCIHPPDNDSKRAFNQSDSILPVKPYLDINKDIVDMSNILISTPETSKEDLHTGAWFSVRYAKRTGKEVIICKPEERVKDTPIF
jgi:glycerol-3-phosphate cytidylyltransferase-like family protein